MWIVLKKITRCAFFSYCFVQFKLAIVLSSVYCCLILLFFDSDGDGHSRTRCVFARFFFISNEPIYFKLVHIEWVPSKINLSMFSVNCCCFWFDVMFEIIQKIGCRIFCFVFHVYLVKWTMRDRCSCSHLSHSLASSFGVEQWFLGAVYDQMQKLSFELEIYGWHACDSRWLIHSPKASGKRFIVQLFNITNSEWAYEIK